MSDLRQAAQQALEALEEINKLSIGEHAICLPGEIDTAMDALRAALAEPEQEPQYDYRTRYDRPCYKCSSLYCPGNCKEPAHLVQQEPVAWYDSISGQTDFSSYKPHRKPSSPSAEWIPLYAAPTPRKPDINAELLEALKHAAECVQKNYLPDRCGHDWDEVIAKAEASK